MTRAVKPTSGRSLLARVLAVGLVAVLTGLIPLGAADASGKKHFSQVYSCASSDDSDQLGSADDLEAIIEFGHWAQPNKPGHPCFGGKKFVPSATGVTVTFRWYAGGKVIRTSGGKTLLHPGGRYDDLLRAVTGTPGQCGWYLGGKKVIVKAVLAKKHYVTKSVTIGCFPGGDG
ncbi:MAG TPA: hypothetical protein VHZ06_02900 [Marmoricola sp.]|jgi:hypothetical protein|nr:hypothetical protein [Marmoricola sp.]